MPLLEVCASNLESARAAAEGGAERIELCRDLDKDGLTPSAEDIAAAKSLSKIKVFVLIRSREGNFIYDSDELSMMEEQIIRARELGADGIVIGALTPEGEVDMPACRRLIKAAWNLPVTFHRAFDQASDPFRALEDIISLGCTRLLTSGQANTALEGCELISKLVQQAQGRIIIMPGAGVNPGNAKEILHRTGCTEIHSSARKSSNQKHTDPATVAAILDQIL